MSAIDDMYLVRSNDLHACLRCGGRLHLKVGQRLDPWTWTRLATFTPDEEGDGGTCVVEVQAAPARFYRLLVEGAPFASTGSGMAEWCAQTAAHIADGMVVIEVTP